MTMVAHGPRGLRSPLLTTLSRRLQFRHYSERTTRSYIRWVVRYVRFHGTRHPSELGQDDVVDFLSALASGPAACRADAGGSEASDRTNGRNAAARGDAALRFWSPGSRMSAASRQGRRFLSSRNPGARR